MTTKDSKRAGSLTFPANPLAAMRELSDLDRPSAPSKTESNQESTDQTIQSYDNMTNKPSEKPDDNIRDKPIRNKVGPAVSKDIRQSVAQLIRQRTSKEADKEVLKTVTLKISPTLDERIERYCFENKIKKQDFWAEAAALYFETVEQAE